MNLSKKRSKTVLLLCMASAFSWAVSWAGVPGPEKSVTLRTTPVDWIRAENGQLNIQGKILLSYEEKFVFVQSGKSYLKIQRELIKTAKQAKLDQPGARVSFQIPQRAISYAWSVP